MPEKSVPATVEPAVPLLPYQLEDVESDARLRWSCWARQTGKSFTKSLRRVLRGLLRGRNQIFLSAGERQSRELMLKARQHCQALKIAADFIDTRYFQGTSFKQLEILLPNRVRVIGLAANPQTARGFTGDVFLDEFAMHADDRAIWAALFPALLRGNGELDVASTPKGKQNVFYKLSANPDFQHGTVTLPDAVEQGLKIDPDKVRESMGDEALYRQEFLCEFLDESTAFLTYEQIAACQDPLLSKEVSWPQLGDAKQELFAGIDVGRRRDMTVIWILARCGDVYETRGVIEMAQVPFRRQYEEVSRLLSLKTLRRCCIDAGGLGMQLAESAAEDFGAHRAESVTLTNALKEQLAGRLRICVEDRTVRIPVDEAIRNDWHSIRRSTTASGHVRYEAARREGSHADRFWAAALALQAAGSSGGVKEVLTTRTIQFARNGIW